MIHIATSAIQPDEGIRLPFYLAIEEWVARYMPADEYFFTWCVDPTVICGRNQDVAHEVDLDFCREHGINVYRRRSGGGCVYSDRGNLMISYIGPNTDVASAFASYTAHLADMLRSLGLNAEVSGRNDVLVDGRKVSGNAFYRGPKRSIIHGTLLFETNPEFMTHAITPARSKLRTHGVASVESRITTLSKYLPDWSLQRLSDYVVQSLAHKSITIQPESLPQIREIEQAYYDLTWIFGHGGILGRPDSTARISKHIDGVGQFNVLMQLDDDKIAEVDLTGDFFMLSDLDAAIFNKIKGCRLDRDALTQALDGVDVSQAISGLTTEAFIDLILSARKRPVH